MRVERLPGLLKPGSLAAAYVGDFPRVSSLYRHDAGDEASFAARAGLLRDRQGADRAALAAALLEYNRSLEADETVLENVRRLADPEAVCVVTGQQAGVFTGPLYTLYKALQAVALARELSPRLGRPVVPVFWVASEDHDFTEIDHLDVLDRQGELHRLRLPMEVPSRLSAGHIPAGDAAQALLSELLALLPETEFLPDLAANLERLTGAGGSLADWFARLLTWLLAGQGLVLLDPLQPALRRLAGPFVARLLEQNEALGQGLRRGVQEVEALGYPPAVGWEEGAANLFTYHEGRRLALVRTEGGFAGRGGEVTWSTAEAVRLAAAEPERFSGSVVTRPLIQDYLLPTLAYVGGPGEISYYGGYRHAYEAMDLSPPVYVTRTQVTLLEPSVARYLDKLGLGAEQAVFSLEAARRQRLEQQGGVDLPALFAVFREDFDRRYGELLATVTGLDRSLEQVAVENVRQIHAQFGRLEEKARQQQRKHDEQAMRQFDRIALHLVPRGQPQERVYNVLYYRAKFGPDLVSRLLHQVPLARGGHYAVWPAND